MLNSHNIMIDNDYLKSYFNRNSIKRVRPIVKINHNYSSVIVCDSCSKNIKVKSYYCDVVKAEIEPDTNITNIKIYRFCKKCSGDILEKISE